MEPMGIPTPTLGTGPLGSFPLSIATMLRAPGHGFLVNGMIFDNIPTVVGGTFPNQNGTSYYRDPTFYDIVTYVNP